MSNDIGPLGPRLDGVRRIAVLRGGGLGDLVFALPAIQALKDTYPDADVTLLGTPAHAALLADRPGPISRVLPLPVATGVFQPEHTEPDPAEQDAFFRRANAERFDLAVQAHGGGRWSNPFVRRLGARHAIGAVAADAEPLDRCLPYRYYQHEALRWLELVGLVGATGSIRARLAVTERDQTAGARALAGLPRPVVTIHPGATDPRRRWPITGFADVAARLATDGLGVAVIGSADETELVDRVVRRAHHRAVRGLAGKVDLTGLVGTLAASAVVLANDSGPRHLAEAVGVPTVGVFWCGNMINAGPFGRATRRVRIGWTVRCPACGRDLTAGGTGCGHRDSWVADVRADDLHADVRDLLD
jgi:ADP-heptose:LPS heptosyltransferase